MDNKTLKISKLSSQYLAENLTSFLLMERDYPEPWSPQNFLMELSLKWELSRYAEVGGNPAGFIVASFHEDTVALHRFMVDPIYRDNHFGGKLHADFELGCRKLSNVKKITLNVLADNKRAISFYEQFGYKISDTKALNLHYKMEKFLLLP